jgi:predicted ribosomally synthesized peptide with SipW-like signal peptide
MNNNQKATRRALLTSVMALVMCVVMLVGTTFAWFTDTASTAVNKIQAGNLDVDIVGEDGKTLDGKTLNFKDANNNTDILWEPGATFFTQGFKIVNKGNLALKYKVVVSGTTGDAKLLKAIDFAFVTDNTTPDANPESFANEGKLLKQNDSAPANNGVYYLRGHMKEEAGNEYKDLTLDGISITVYATQYTYEKDSFDDQYDANAGKDTAYYTLAEFNALTEIPEGVKTVYVNLSGKSLQNGLTIGNADIADHYHYGEWNSEVAPAGYPHKTSIDNYTTHDGDKVRYIYSTGKPSVNVILTGSVLGASDTGDFNAGAITLQVPDAANVVFDKVTFGAGQMAMSMWTESYVQSMTVAHRIASVTFDGCTFNGNWIQNGAFGADEMVIKNSTFNIHENVGYKNNSNPVWIQNMGQCNVTIEGCTVNAVRPIKLWEGTASGTVTIKNNTFNMSNFADATGDDAYKNVAIMFCGTKEQVKLGNVEITGNTVTGNATGFICFYNNSTQYPSMNTSATFKLSGNTLPVGVAESVLWKSNTGWQPDYVTK